MNSIFRLTALIPVLLIAVSCASLNQKTTLAPLSAEFPVSASRSLYTNGTTIEDDKFTGSKPFEATKAVKLPVLQKEAAVDFTPDLKSQLDGTDYKGITQLKISVLNIDSSAISWIATERNVGAWVGVLGVGLIALEAVIPTANGGGNYIPGIIGIGAGAAIFGTSYLHENFGTIDYNYDLSGVKVKY